MISMLSYLAWKWNNKINEIMNICESHFGVDTANKSKCQENGMCNLPCWFDFEKAA